MDPKRILITRTDRLGDVVLSTPVIRFLRRQYPDAYIALMVRPQMRDVVLHDPHLNEVIIYDKYGDQRSFLATLKFAFILKEKKFDTAIALHPTNRAHMLMFLAGIPRRIGYNRNMPFLLTEKITHNKQEGAKHEVDYNFDLLKEAGFDVGDIDRMPYMVTGEEEKKLVDSVIVDRNIGKNIIAIHPGASCPSKKWPPERFSETADVLAEKYGYDIALIGAEETSEIAERIISQMKHKAIDLTGLLLVGELAEFLSRCKLLISNDSGPVHVAVSVGTPVVAIFGRSDPGLSPKRWGPLGKDDIILHKDVGCDECLAHNCVKDFACLKAITAGEVIEAAGKALKDMESVSNV